MVGDASRQAMKEILADVQSGAFAKRWIAEARGGREEFNKMRESETNHAIESVGHELRSHMAWL